MNLPAHTAPGPVGVIVNPSSGRDVRRIAARASTTTIESKRDQVARAVVGAAASGAPRILIARDLLSISTRAVESLRLHAEIEILTPGAKYAPSDTVLAAEALRDAGCAALIVFGGDGTNRIVAGAWPDAPLVPLSTGTNNAFPYAVEASVGGAAAGLVASGRVSIDEVSRRAKIVRVEIEGEAPDLAVVDAAFLVDDHVGNLLPFETDKIRRAVLARAEPATVGVSPLGGLLRPSGVDDDFGVDVRCAPPEEEGRALLVPISPGLYRSVNVAGFAELAFGEVVELTGPGILAFDGDRERTLAPGQRARLSVVREGPRVIDIDATLALAADRELYLDHHHWHDPYDDSGAKFDCC